MKKLNLTFAILLTSLSLFAADPTDTVADGPSIGLTSSELLIVALFIFALVSLFATYILLKALRVILDERKNPTPYIKYQDPEPLDYVEWVKLKKRKPNIWTKILSLKPIEEENQLLIPHAYDGIQELNNPVPKWFSILFYGTIIFAACYLYYYHIGDGPLQEQEYATEIEKAAEAKKAFLSKAAEKFDEHTVKIDSSLIANGKNVFMANCIACHGEHGQGLVGPNLTDEFWLHGGSVSDVFKTVKYGVPAKGMASWEKNLSSKNIAEVVNYILSLQGTKPQNPKAPQGEKFKAVNVSDTVKNESATTK